MEQWKDRVAVVTGASAGIGRAIALALLDAGLIVVALARRDHLLQELVVACADRPGRLHARRCDVSDDEETVAAFQWVDETLGGADVLVNNAGVAGSSSLLEGDVSEWRHLLDVNVVALNLCTREAVRSMRRRDAHGHVIHISSYSATVVPAEPAQHFYSATKHAVRALTEGLRQELRDCGSHIRVTNITPGLVNSDLYRNAVSHQEARAVYDGKPYLRTLDIASAVLYVLTTPPRVQIHDIILKPLGEAL